MALTTLPSGSCKDLTFIDIARKIIIELGEDPGPTPMMQEVSRLKGRKTQSKSLYWVLKRRGDITRLIAQSRISARQREQETERMRPTVPINELPASNGTPNHSEAKPKAAPSLDDALRILNFAKQFGGLTSLREAVGQVEKLIALIQPPE